MAISKYSDIIIKYCVRNIDDDKERLSTVKTKIEEVRSDHHVESFKIGMTDNQYRGRFKSYKSKNPDLKNGGKMVLLYEDAEKQPVIDFEKELTCEFKGIDDQCRNEKCGGGEIGDDPNFYVYMVISPLEMLIESVETKGLSPI